MGKDQILAVVQKAILSLNDDLMIGDITEEAMLVDGFGLDSLNLAHLVENLRQTYRNINFTPWFVEASRDGRDTVGILVDFIARGFRGVPGAGDAL